LGGMTGGDLGNLVSRAAGAGGGAGVDPGLPWAGLGRPVGPGLGGIRCSETGALWLRLRPKRLQPSDGIAIASS
ncbi:MAG: hypothetical protein AAF191_18925, partial [Verrucomicrobiota bacterium]